MIHKKIYTGIIMSTYIHLYTLTFLDCIIHLFVGAIMWVKFWFHVVQKILDGSIFLALKGSFDYVVVHYCSTSIYIMSPKIFFPGIKNLRTWVGIEPTTLTPRVWCSTNWATKSLGARWWPGKERYTSASSWCPLHQKVTFSHGTCTPGSDNFFSDHFFLLSVWAPWNYKRVILSY